MTIKGSKQEYWRGHVELGLKYPGGKSAYCRSEGLKTSSFHYWNSKFNKTKTVPALMSPSFIPVSVSRVERNLPDPQWLAQFLGELMGRNR